MLGLNKKLKELQSYGDYIKIGLVGLGQMGSSMAVHVNSLAGMKMVAVADLDVNNAANILAKTGYDLKDLALIEAGIKINSSNKGAQIIKAGVNLSRDIEKAVKSGKTIVTDDISILTGMEDIDVVVDATGNPEAGAKIAFSAISSGKHMVTFNVEADTTIGPLLKKMADNSGIVYTVAAGDEPAAAKELFDMADALGLEIVAAGKGKNNPLDKEANPDTLAEYAAQKGSSAKMMTSFVDGTKSMFEMACLSNATGLVPDIRGMHGASVNVDGEKTEELCRAINDHPENNGNQPCKIKSSLFNVFEKVYHNGYEEFRSWKEHISRLGIEELNLAGSGPAVYCISDSEEGLLQIANQYEYKSGKGNINKYIARMVP